MTQTAVDHPDVYRVVDGDRTIYLVGTAHVSQQSTDLVESVINELKPDTVCVELDAQRYEALSQEKKWESLDLKEVIRKKQISTLIVNILLASYQKRMGDKLGVLPGAELLAATRVADSLDIPVVLCDRDVRITLRRAWASMSFWEKMKLSASGLAGVIDDVELTEDDLAELRESDAITDLMQGLGEAMPTLKTVLIDERDGYLASKISDAPGKSVVAVVGAGHVKGMVEHLENKREVDLEEIEKIPPSSPVFKWIGWAIPVLILGAIIAIGITQGAQAAGDNALYWFLANAVPCGLGAVLAFAHPVTILSAFFAAPFTSLTPVIGAGYVAAFVQAYVKPPVVREFKTVNEDIGHIRNWWTNHLLRIFLVFILTSLGSIIGTYVGGFEIFTNLF